MREKFGISEDNQKRVFQQETEEALDTFTNRSYNEGINTIPENIEIVGNTEDKIPLINEAVNFAKNLSEEFETKLYNVIKSHPKISLKTKEKVFKLIENNRFNKPIFKIIADENSQKQYFDNLGWQVDIAPNKIIMVYDFPKPISRFWQKKSMEYDEDNYKWFDTSVNMPWGDLYNHLVHTVWEHLDSQRPNGALVIKRVNYVGEHESENYYYIWQISLRSS